MKPTDLPSKIAAKIRIDAETGCWMWVGTIARNYGSMVWPTGSKKYHYAHRLVWQLLKGPVPDGLVLDHLCRIKLCVNPVHLEPVTQAENARRIGGRPNTEGGLCRNGHPWNSATTYVSRDGHRRCSQCRRDRGRRRTATGRNRERRQERMGDPAYREQERERNRQKHLRRRSSAGQLPLF